jgi:hypothetical protein
MTINCRSVFLREAFVACGVSHRLRQPWAASRRATLVPQLTRIDLTIIMVSPGRSEVSCLELGYFRIATMETPAELMDLNRILLNLARSRDFPNGSSRHGYDFIAPLDPQGHIDPILWKKYRDYCRVRRFWEGEDDEIGRLVHKPGGAEHARWVFDYNPDDDEDDEAGYKFGTHAFLPDEYVSIGGQGGKLHTFRVISVDPVVLSVALIKSFRLDIKV